MDLCFHACPHLLISVFMHKIYASLYLLDLCFHACLHLLISVFMHKNLYTLSCFHLACLSVSMHLSTSWHLLFSVSMHKICMSCHDFLTIPWSNHPRYVAKLDHQNITLFDSPGLGQVWVRSGSGLGPVSRVGGTGRRPLNLCFCFFNARHLASCNLRCIWAKMRAGIFQTM